MSKLIPILNFEEGYKERPYLDSLGYPTVAGGIRIGPQGASISYYQFKVPRSVGDVWKQTLVDEKTAAMRKNNDIFVALSKCNPPRADILYSMAYQMGVSGLAYFKSMLNHITNEDFEAAANEMMRSLWAKQTPNRAKRHADVMRQGNYDAYKGLI